MFWKTQTISAISSLIFLCQALVQKRLKQIHCITKQECIPVGCVPAARWPYAGVCFPGGVWSGEGVVLGVCVVQGGGGPGGSGPGGSGPRGSGPGGSPYPGGSPCQRPPLWAESQTPVKTLPWPNFVAAGKYRSTSTDGQLLGSDKNCTGGDWNTLPAFPLTS